MSAFRVARMHRFRRVMATIVIHSLLTANVTGCVRVQLPQNIPRARVCLHPPPVDKYADFFAYRALTDEWVSDTDEDEFEDFAPFADRIYIYDATMPSMSLSAFPAPFNLLSCDNPNAVIPRAVYTGQRLPFAYDLPLMQAGRARMSTTITDIDPRNARFVGVVESSQKRRGPEIIPVCTHPPYVRADAKEWLFTTEKAGASYTSDPELYARLRATAVRVYVFDPDAPAESVLRFPKPYDQLRCPGKPIPGNVPPPGADPDYKAAIDAQVKAIMAKASVSEFGGTGGSDKRTWTSAPTGEGAPLSFFEAVVRQMVIAGAFQGGDTEGNLKDPNGARYGLANGKNVGGPDALILQLTAGTFMVLKAPLRSVNGFISKVVSAAKRKGVLIITNPAFMPKKLAEKLVERFGESMAPSLHLAKTILPFSRAQMFTAGWGMDYQAHKILERNMWKKVFKREDFENLPAIILKEAEHTKISKTLKEAGKELLRVTKGKPSEKQLWAMYKEVYAHEPNWLKAIEHYFQP